MRTSTPKVGRRPVARLGAGRLADRLRWRFEGLEQSPDRRDRAAMATASVYMLGGGAVLSVLMMLLAGTPGRNTGVTLALMVVSGLVGLVCLVRYDSLPRWFLAATPAVVTALITADLLFSDDERNSAPVFFFVVALYAFTLLPVPAAACHIGLIAASQALVVVLRPNVVNADNAVVTIAVLAATAYAIVRSNRRLRELVSDLSASKQATRHSAEETVRRLSLAAEFRDTDSGGHVRRMSEYCALVARELGLDNHRCELIRIASLLHDIGKIGVPDHVLRKAGPLELDEIRAIRAHAKLGHEILFGSNEPMLDLAAAIALTHHERWDGKGYPEGRSGTEIPIEGRIAAVADVFDALTNARAYRAAHSVPDAFVIMAKERGGAFDPDVLDAFFRCRDAVLEIRRMYADTPEAAEIQPAAAAAAVA